jgi:hypothetical protein
MRTLLHLSDLHFGRIDPEVVEELIRQTHELKPSLIYSQAQPVVKTYRMPLMISRSSIRGRPVSAGGGNSGLMNSHWASVKSEGYGFLFSSCIRAFSAQLLYQLSDTMKRPIRAFVKLNQTARILIVL